MKASEETRRIETRASHTAYTAAIYRFLASKERRSGFTGPDHLAYVFLRARAKFFLSFAFFRDIFKQKLDEKGPGSYAYVSARTRYFDDLFKQALETHIPQIVILGAGYDTRFVRFQDKLNETAVFELDVPSTQKEKLKILRKNNISIPDRVHHVPINFDTDDLKKSLFRAGYDPTRRSLFLWEGVTMYITDKAVNQTMAFVKANSGPGSSIAFDYLYESVIRGECNYYGARALYEEVKKNGVAFRFGIKEGQVKEFLKSRGFTGITHYSPQLFETTYLYDDSGEFFGNMYGFACHVLAEANT
jgi:methyltransferase (TIGR00027 family)